MYVRDRIPNTYDLFLQQNPVAKALIEEESEVSAWIECYATSDTDESHYDDPCSEGLSGPEKERVIMQLLGNIKSYCERYKETDGYAIKAKIFMYSKIEKDKEISVVWESAKQNLAAAAPASPVDRPPLGQWQCVIL